MRSTTEQLLALAGKRVASPQHQLCEVVRDLLPGLRFDRSLVPEAFSVGYHTPFWEQLAEDERLALNHWTWSLMYTRISDGEEYVRDANTVIADWLRPHAPAVADLIAREADEERDHIAAFRAVKQAIDARHGVGHLRHPKKPGRKLLVNERAVRLLLDRFGADYVVMYFVARGIANHMGMGFERPVARMTDGDQGLTRLSLLHTQDESQHMAVSHLMAAAARDLLPERRRGPLYRLAVRELQRRAAHYTFSESMSKALERKVCHRFVPNLTPLRRRPAGFVRELVDAHFDGLSGIERSRNRTLGKQNARLLAEAALPEEDRQLWARTLVGGQENLRFLEGEPAA